MKSLSVFQIVLLSVFGALAISGMLIFALVVGSNTGNSIGPITIWGTLEQSAFAVVLRQASEDDKRLSQVTYVEKDAATYEEELTEALASGEGPDLFLLRQDFVVRNRGKVIPVPSTFLSEAKFKDTFVEAANPYLAEAGVLGIPLFVDPMILYWNRDLLAASGFPKPPRYWEEVPEFAQKVTKRDDAGGIVHSAIAFGEFANVDFAKDIITLLIQQAGGTITSFDSTGRLVPSLTLRRAGEPSQATESALRFYTEFADPSKIHYSWNRSLSSSRAEFAAGDLALYLGYGREATLLARMNPNLNYAGAAVPQSKVASRSTNAARVYALAISRTSQNPQGAMTVAAVMADAPIARALSVATGIPSARRDVLAEKLEGENELFEGQALIARSWVDPDPQKTDAIFRGMIEGVTTGSSRLQEAIGRANQELAQAIGQ
ncbi:MAG: extracellular solute-binding protein [Candidatus Komeilibacteria bacterium]|nr:extracellular solute-binding protein [Candidatus Komeilibacteria bacterium]